MEQSIIEERRETVALLIADPILAEITAAELTALHCEVLTVHSPEQIPMAHPPTVVDLDGLKPSEAERLPMRLIGITRSEHALSALLRARCRTVLHRPLSLDSFRAAVMGMLRDASESPKANPEDAKNGRRTSKSPTALSLSPTGNTILCDGNEIALTPGEMTVFLTLFRARGETVTREALAAQLRSESGSNLPDVHVCAIRKKLLPYGRDALLHTVRGVGYQLLTPHERL